MAERESKESFRERVKKITGFKYGDIPYVDASDKGHPWNLPPGPILCRRGSRNLLVCWTSWRLHDEYCDGQITDKDLTAEDFVRWDLR